MNELSHTNGNRIGHALPVDGGENSTDLVAARSRAQAEVQASYMIAQARPRSILRVRDRVQEACQLPELAEIAEYQYARGGQDITGPSIHLLRAVARECGNIKSGFEETRREGLSSVRCYAVDLETNTEREIKIDVRHLRHTRGGAKVLTDDRDIYELVANQAARRERACLEAIIPAGLIRAAREQVSETLKATVSVTPATNAKLLERFAEFGVTKQQIETRIQRKLASITPAQVLGLRRIYSSLTDGMSEPSEWFAADETDAPRPTSAAEKAKAAAAKVTQPKADATAGKSSHDDFAERMNTSRVGVLEALREPISTDAGLTDEQRETLLETLEERIAIVQGEAEEAGQQ